MLERVALNEKNGVPTLLYLDRLDELIPPYQRTNGGSETPSVEVSHSMQTRNPVINVLREFGTDLGGDIHHLIIFGESRAPRDYLPEGVQRMFRRVVSLEPMVQDLTEIVAVQISQTRRNAEKTGHNPVSQDVDSQLERIAQRATGLTGNDIKQAILNMLTNINLIGMAKIIHKLQLMKWLPS